MRLCSAAVLLTLADHETPLWLDPAFAGARDWVAFHCGAAFAPADVARKLGLSPRYVQDLLHGTGMSFTERVTELRLQRARAMLRASHDAKVIDIALACGFNDVSYFNRCFRRRFGAAPNEFRSGSG